MLSPIKPFLFPFGISGLTVITTPSGKAAKTIREEFAKGVGHSCLKFREIKVDDLVVEEPQEGGSKGRVKGRGGGGVKGGRRR